MVSSYTPNKNLEKPANGDYVDDWNLPVNGDWDIIDTALGGTITVNVVGASGTIALTDSDYQPSNVIFQGLLTANVNYQLPSGVGGQWSVYNNTTGNYTVTVSSAGGGSGLVLRQGFRTLVVADGTNVSLAFNAPINPGGSTTQIQYNDSGVLAGSSKFVFDGTNYLYSSTKVGIGTATPGTELDVKGTLRLSGSASGYVGFAPASAAGSTTYTLPSADGSNGQLLTTNGSGILSWSTLTPAAGVSSFSGGSTGLTPSSPTTGTVTLAGTLAVSNGGTGSTTAAGARTALGSSGSLARTASGTAANSGLISWGTSAPGTLAEGEIYFRYS